MDVAIEESVRDAVDVAEGSEVEAQADADDQLNDRPEVVISHYS